MRFKSKCFGQFSAKKSIPTAKNLLEPYEYQIKFLEIFSAPNVVLILRFNGVKVNRDKFFVTSAPENQYSIRLRNMQRKA